MILNCESSRRQPTPGRSSLPDLS